MIRNSRKYQFLLLLGCLLVLNGYTQFSAFNFNSHAANLKDIESSELSVFPISGYGYKIQTPYALNTLFGSGSEGNVVDLALLANKAKRTNNLFVDAEVDWLTYTRVLKDKTECFSISEHAFVGVGLSKDLMVLAGYGNRVLTEREALLRLRLSELHYQKFSYSRFISLSKELDIGYAANFYLAKSVMNLNASAKMESYEPIDSIRFRIDGSGVTSHPLMLSQFTGGRGNQVNIYEYLAEYRNPGVGVDVSIDYQLDKNTELKAGIKNLGLILWNANTTSFNMDDDYLWSGIDMSGKLDFSAMGNLNENATVVGLRDTFLNELVQYQINSFVTLAPAKLYGAVVFQQSKKQNYIGVADVQWAGTFLRWNAGILTDYKLGDFTTISGGINVTNNSWLNLPVNVKYKRRGVNVLLTTYNLLGVVVPGLNNTFGGELKVCFAIDRKLVRRLEGSKRTPFYQPRIRKGNYGRLF